MHGKRLLTLVLGLGAGLALGEAVIRLAGVVPEVAFVSVGRFRLAEDSELTAPTRETTRTSTSSGAGRTKLRPPHTKGSNRALSCGGETDRPPNVILIVVDTLRADSLATTGMRDRPPRRRTTLASTRPCSGAATRPRPGLVPAWPAYSRERTRHATGSWPTAPDWAGRRTRPPRSCATNGWRTVGHSFNVEVSETTGYDQGFDEFHGVEGDAQAYPDISKMTDRVSAWLDTAPAEPFFLYLQPMNVHGPYKVPPEHRSALPRPAKGEPRTLLFQTDWQSRCQARAIIRDGHS